MDNKKDELNEALGAFISRRKMIQMMGIGTAGAAFLPSLLNKCSWAVAQIGSFSSVRFYTRTAHLELYPSGLISFCRRPCFL